MNLGTGVAVAVASATRQACCLYNGGDQLLDKRARYCVSTRVEHFFRRARHVVFTMVDQLLDKQARYCVSLQGWNTFLEEPGILSLQG